MKKKLLLIFVVLCASKAMAQDPIRDYNSFPPESSYDYYEQNDWNQRVRVNSRNDYDYDNVTNISAGWQRLTLSFDEEPNLISNFGCFAQVTTTYKLIDLSDIFCIGFDASWLELNYANYKIRINDYGTVEEKTYHQGELSVQAGISGTLALSDEIFSSIYVRYAPSFDVLHRDETLYGGFSSFFVAGLSFYYGQFGIGSDFRYGISKYSKLNSDKNENMPKELPNSNTIGFRCYLSFKF